MCVRACVRVHVFYTVLHIVLFFLLGERVRLGHD